MPKKSSYYTSNIADASVVITEPNEKQKMFFAARTRYVGYGGAKGGGKSWAVRVKAFAGAQNFPGIKILIMRQHYPELEKNIIQPMTQLIPDALASYNGTNHTMTFRNGSTIVFGHWNGEVSKQEYQGLEFDWIFIDEATQFTEDAFWYLGGCLRGVNEIPKRMYITCNPGGVGHRWVKRLFIDQNYKTNCANPEENENPEDFTFIFARAEDNKAMMDTPDGRAYLLSLAKMPNGRAMREGDWDAMGGNYFKSFSPELHVVQPFKIPEHWPRYRAFDYGLDMLACYWFAVDEDGRSWCYKGVTAEQKIVQDAAKLIQSATLPGENIVTTYAPTDIWSRQKDTGKTMADVFMENGVGLSKADRNRVQGHMMVADMLMPGKLNDPFVKKLYGDDREDLPMLMFFDTCPDLVSNLQDIQASDADPNDCAKEPHEITHTVDALRYFCIMRTMEAEKQREIADELEDDDDQSEDYEDVLCGGVITESYMNF